MQVQEVLNKKGFKVIHVNTRSIKKKVDELSVFLHNFSIDVITCSETWLHEGIEDACLIIPNYNLFRQDRLTLTDDNRPKRGGGLLTYICSDYTVDHLKYSHLNMKHK